jgi:hypothetical protein
MTGSVALQPGLVFIDAISLLYRIPVQLKVHDNYRLLKTYQQRQHY